MTLKAWMASILVRGCVRLRKARLNSMNYLDRNVSDLDPVELAILRLAAWEFSQRIDVPYRVVLNEGIELAKTFGATDGHKYVNGVLDKLAAKLRGEEVRENRSRK